MGGWTREAEVWGRERDRRLCRRSAEYRRACWEFLQEWRPASSPGSGRLHRPRTGCHTGRCWRAAGPPRWLAHKVRLGIWLACEKQAWESRRGAWWRHKEGNVSREEVFSVGGQETWVASDTVLETACFEGAEVKVGGQESGLPRPQPLCRVNHDLKHFGHYDQGKREVEVVDLEGQWSHLQAGGWGHPKQKAHRVEASQ